ncbi:uncharacterized protein METZ01_LOCUS123666 [marine metagenome]|uniref:Uncharacterized protein n=1 Tax=marine metagenome TaxID=408172 RepID=A0A381Y281_9ZZZZ
MLQVNLFSPALSTVMFTFDQSRAMIGQSGQRQQPLQA